MYSTANSARSCLACGSSGVVFVRPDGWGGSAVVAGAGAGAVSCADSLPRGAKPNPSTPQNDGIVGSAATAKRPKATTYATVSAAGATSTWGNCGNCGT